MTAAPSMASRLTASSASLASSRRNAVTLGRIPISAAICRKSRASARVMLATLRIWRSPHSKPVVIELGNAVEMDGIDRHHAALPQAAERRDHHISAGREGNRPVEFDWWPLGFGANPGRSHRPCQLAMRLSPRRDIDLALPGVQHFNRQVRRSSEAEQSDAFPRLHFRDPKAAKADDARAQQRRGPQIIQLSGQREDKVRAGGCVFRITTVHRIASERGRVAEVLFAALTIPAGAVGAADPRHAHARAQRQLGCRAGDDVAHNLVSGYERDAPLRQFAFGDMQVGPANATGADFQQDVSRGRLRLRHVFNLQRALGDRRRACSERRPSSATRASATIVEEPIRAI